MATVFVEVRRRATSGRRMVDKRVINTDTGYGSSEPPVRRQQRKTPAAPTVRVDFRLGQRGPETNGCCRGQKYRPTFNGTRIK